MKYKNIIVSQVGLKEMETCLLSIRARARHQQANIGLQQILRDFISIKVVKSFILIIIIK